MPPRRNRRVMLEAPVNVDLPVDLVRMLDDFCDGTGVKKKQAIELALRRFLSTETAPAAKR